MSKLLGFRVNEQGLEAPKKVTARELVSELAPSDELQASTKRMSEYLLTLPITTPEYQKLLNMLRNMFSTQKHGGLKRGLNGQSILTPKTAKKNSWGIQDQSRLAARHSHE